MAQGGARLQSRVAVITGAADGIGRAAAILFAREGARLVIADLNQQALAATEQMVRELPAAEVVSRKTDVSVEEQVRALIEYLCANP